MRSVIPFPGKDNLVKLSIASAVIGAPGGRSRVKRMAAAKWASGIETSACTGCVVNCTKAVNNRLRVRSVIFFI